MNDSDVTDDAVVVCVPDGTFAGRRQIALLKTAERHWLNIARAMDAAVHAERFGCEVRVDALGGGMIPNANGPWIHIAAMIEGQRALVAAKAAGLTWEEDK